MPTWQVGWGVIICGEECDNTVGKEISVSVGPVLHFNYRGGVVLDQACVARELQPIFAKATVVSRNKILVG